jgi:hypothetical protein
MVGLPRRPKLSQLRSISIRQTFFFLVLNLPKEIHNWWTGRRDPEKKGREERAIRGAAIVGVCGAGQESAIPRGAIRGKSVYAGKLCGDGKGGGARKRKNERHNATSNNLTRKHTNSTMQIIERKCKAQKVAGTMI